MKTPSKSIHNNGDAILPQTGKKLITKCGPEYGGLLWRRDAIWHRIEKLKYRCTTTIPHMHKSAKDVWKNLLPVWLLVRTNLFIPSRFWTIYTNFDTCCHRYIATCGKNLYRCISTFSALNYCSGFFFFKSSAQRSYEVVRTNLSADFLNFRNF